VTPKSQGRDPIIFEAALKLFNFYHWPTQLTHLIYTDFSVSYRDALDSLRVRLNSILFGEMLNYNILFSIQCFMLEHCVLCATVLTTTRVLQWSCRETSWSLARKNASNEKPRTWYATTFCSDFVHLIFLRSLINFWKLILALLDRIVIVTVYFKLKSKRYCFSSERC